VNESQHIPFPKHIESHAHTPDIRLTTARKVAVSTTNPLLFRSELGTRKLVTICVFDANGDQIKPPFFKNKATGKKVGPYHRNDEIS
jgi:hypothetical protein